MLILTLKRAKFPTLYPKITIRLKKIETDRPKRKKIYKMFVNQKTEASKQTEKTKNISTCNYIEGDRREV